MPDTNDITDMGTALDDASAQYSDTTSVNDTPIASDTKTAIETTASDSTTETSDAANSSEDSDNQQPDDNTIGDNPTKTTDKTEVKGGDKRNNLTPEQLNKRREFNHAQAAARIARKRAKEQKEYYEKRQRLAEDHKAYSDDKNAKYDPTMAAVKQDQLQELDLQQAKYVQNQFVEEAYEIFQSEKETNDFIEDCNTYGDWINEKEPQLGEYIRKPYGKLLLKGWFDKVAKVPEAADWWESLTPFEKYKTLDNYYNEFDKYIKNLNSGKQDLQQAQQQSKPVVKEAPVPSSGRNTNNMPPTNNFSLELDRAMQANGVTRLVR